MDFSWYKMGKQMGTWYCIAFTDDDNRNIC